MLLVAGVQVLKVLELFGGLFSVLPLNWVVLRGGSNGLGSVVSCLWGQDVSE